MSVSISECDRTERHRASLDDRMRAAIGAFTGWKYSEASPSWFWPLPGVKGKKIVYVDDGAPEQTNCCAFALSVILRALELEQLGLDRYKRAMVFDRTDRRGPVDVWAEHLAEVVPSSSPGWWVCQGWRGPKEGHTFLVRQTARGLIVVEANSSAEYKVRGVGVRSIGLLDERGTVLDTEPAAAGWSWGRLRATYPELHVGRLKD